MRTPFSAFVTLTVLSVSSLVGLASAPAHASCHKTPQGSGQIPDNPPPWHLELFKLGTLPSGLTGKGVKVAVLDSGVDGSHPSMAGQVIEPPLDTLHGLTTPQDCVGHGTGVAGVIAALDKKGTNYRGIAPGAKILAARVSENVAGKEDAAIPKPENMARAVDWAVQSGAKVINMSFTYNSEDGLAGFKAAVQRAIAAGVVVIAAAGNKKKEDNPTPYPAAWPDVVGVGAIGPEGFQRLDASQTGPYVDIAAPGEGIWAPRLGGGFSFANNGTSFAAPMVAATAALIFEQYPRITGDQVVKRLLATADPAPGGRKSAGYGVGIVNPVRAVTDLIDEAPPQKAAPLRNDQGDAERFAAAERKAMRERQALWVAGIVALGVVLAVALMTALPAGSRRRWRAAGE